jgi:curved DNA-binding protein
MNDPYRILGVNKNSSPQDIKQAFKKLAKEYHPDKPDGDEAKFKQINEAYEILKDPKKKEMYDLGGMDPNQPNFHRGRDGSFRFSFGGGEGFDDIIRDFFEDGPMSGNNPFSRMHRRPLRNKDIKITLNCTLEDLYFQNEKELQITAPSGTTRNVKVRIPVNADDNTTIRFKGLGDNTHKDLQPGNLLVTMKVQPHHKFVKIRYDLHLDYKINIFKIITGENIEIDHISNSKLHAKVPELSQPDQIIRLKSKGMPKPNGTYGDLYVKLKPYTPSDVNNKVIETLKKHI